jgi:hypothetical protein
MNITEFRETFKCNQHTKILMQCDKCKNPKNITRWRAEANIIRNGMFICASCCMTDYKLQHPVTETTKEKQRLGRLGKKHTDQAKDKIRQVKNKLYQTPQGAKIKRRLSHLAAKGHAINKFAKSKRHGLYFSKKNQTLVAYNSSYELRLCVELEADSSVISYQTQLYYEVEERCHSLDFLIKYADRKLAVEVKPKSRLTEKESIEQIKDSTDNAIKNGWQFAVYTEDHFGMKYKEIRDWADKFRSTLTGINYVAHRLKKNCEKVKKHYHAKIATDTIQVECNYCQTTHTALRLTYEKNIKRNGRYICEKEGGHIAGSKPKLHLRKDNPYAEQGMKQCTKCQRILPFDCFGFDKGRRDGYASRCKECRNKK